MLQVFDSLKALLKLDLVCIDNNVFRLHYKVTMGIILAFSAIISLRQYVGDPIDCIVDRSIDREFMDNYCWISETYTLPDKNGIIGVDMAHPGVATQTADDSVKYHSYYQWVCFVLVFQALLFYIPRYVWKSWEGGKMKMLVSALVDIYEWSNDQDADAKRKKKEFFVDYIIGNMNNNNFYGFGFFFCECLNFANVLCQFLLMDIFFDHEFSTYGIDVLAMSYQDDDSRTDPMARMFPKVTKCTFNKYGPAGNIVPYDALCVLSINNFNEKIFIFLWFWFCIVAILSGLAVLYHIAIIFVPQLRTCSLRTLSGFGEELFIKRVCLQCQVGDWFILRQLGKNIPTVIFRDLLVEIALKLEYGRVE